MVTRANPYSAILKFRTATRDRFAMDVAAATLDEGRCLRLHSAVEAESARETNACRETVREGEVHGASVLQFSDYQIAQRANLVAARANLTEAVAALTTCRAALNKADVAVRVVQTLRDRKLLAERAQRARREQIEQDDRTGAARCV
ncbi:MAG TPA: hypothetical protein VGE52_03390 [Pirellulales bacterium]